MKPFSKYNERAREDVYKTGQLRRSTLTSLRWMAVAGQLLAVLIVYFVLHMHLALLPCLAVIAISAVGNLLIIAYTPTDRRISNTEAGAQLFFDALQLSILLSLTGGMQNPFAVLLLAPVVVTAKTLDWKIFISIALAVALLSLYLLFNHLPLPWFEGERMELPKHYQYGQWLALQVGMLFTSFYTWRATAQTKRITQALAATDAILAHEKTISALGGLAAAAAHQLGTPLSTIQLVGKEIENLAEPGSELAEDAALLLDQAGHCSVILQELAARGDKGDVVHDRLSLTELIREITEPFIGLKAEIVTELVQPQSEEDVPVLARKPEFVYGLTNIVENAADFAKSEVQVTAAWNDQSIFIEVKDDGPGFAPSVLDKVGEPYISYRPDKKHSAGGMGLGVFIATTLFQRVGGTISFSNRQDGQGACVKMSWPMEKHE